jgi:glycosidase
VSELASSVARAGLSVAAGRQRYDISDYQGIDPVFGSLADFDALLHGIHELDRRSGDYFLHLFSRREPDLNWESPEVRSAVYSMMRWWLGRGVDGFRMNVVNFISEDPALPDGRVVAGGPFGDGTPFYICGPRIHC